MKRRRSPLRTLVRILLVVLVIHLFVVPQLGGAREGLSRLSTVSPVLLALAVVLEGAALATYGELAWRLFPSAVRPHRWVCNGVVLASTAVNHVVPGGAATTAAVNVRLFGRAGVPPEVLGFTLTTQAAGSAIVLNVLLWFAVIASIPASGIHPIYATAAIVGALVMLLVALAVVWLVRGSVWINRFVDALSRRVRWIDPERIRPVVRRVRAQFSELTADRRSLAVLIGLAAANWLLDAAALWVCLAAFGDRPGAIGVLVAYGLANVMAVIPITPGGLGVIEAVLIPSLIGFGNPTSVVAVGVVVYRLINFWLPIPVGLGSYVFVERHLAGTQPEGVKPVLEDLLAEHEHRRHASEATPT